MTTSQERMDLAQLIVDKLIKGKDFKEAEKNLISLTVIFNELCIVNEIPQRLSANNLGAF